MNGVFIFSERLSTSVVYQDCAASAPQCGQLKAVSVIEGSMCLLTRPISLVVCCRGSAIPVLSGAFARDRCPQFHSTMKDSPALPF
jgi:hypothetical protein